ncbi:autoinducer binding domain-containing protein [Roseateles sp. P5_E7]
MLGYQDLLDIGLSPDAETLQGRLVAAVRHLGFGLSGGTLIRGRLSSGGLCASFGNPPDGFYEVFKSRDLAIRDPLLNAMQGQQGCFVYDQDFYVRAGAGELWELQSPFGYRHGMAISIHEFSHAEMFCFGVDSPDPITTNKGERLKLHAHLGLIAQHAQAAATRIHTPAPVVDLNAVSREDIEALRWAADAQSISLHLGKVVITNRGATSRRMLSKLGATSAPMAVLRAIEGGLIDG